MSQRLESFRAVAGHVATWLRPRDSKPTAVFAFRDETSFAPYRLAITGGSSKECLGFFLGGADLNYVGLKAGGPHGSNMVYHELIHDLASRNFAYLPAWLSEGMADYWSTYWSDGKIAEVGRAQESHLRGPLEKAPPVPVGVLFRDKRTPQPHRGGIPELEFYASSWLLVHYLTNAGEATSSRFFRYVEALRAGEAEWRAHKEAFGFDFGSLDAAVAKYRLDGNFRTVRVPLSM